MTTTLQRWGNSQGIRIPKVMVETLGLEIGSDLAIELSDDRSHIAVVPVHDKRSVRRRHQIKDLVAASSPGAFKGEFSWGESQGTEVW
jgi:antitoxin MazE